MLAFGVLDALAGTTRVAGDQRSVHQRRADAFADVFAGIVANGATPDGTPLASTLAGVDERSGFVDSFGRSPRGWP